jgi:hypothetical protein
MILFEFRASVPSQKADAICRLATGAELGGRREYTDFDEAVFTACRPIMLNGIPDVVGQSDVADRCVKLEVRRSAERLAEAVFWHRFEKAWPTLTRSTRRLGPLTLLTSWLERRRSGRRDRPRARPSASRPARSPGRRV